MSALIKHLAFVSESKAVKPADLMKVAAALQKQATRDLGPIWEISATVDAFNTLEDVPLDYWRMIIKDDNRRGGRCRRSQGRGRPTLRPDQVSQRYKRVVANGFP
jgi:hypothetical protein